MSPGTVARIFSMSSQASALGNRLGERMPPAEGSGPAGPPPLRFNHLRRDRRPLIRRRAVDGATGGARLAWNRNMWSAVRSDHPPTPKFVKNSSAWTRSPR